MIFFVCLKTRRWASYSANTWTLVMSESVLRLNTRMITVFHFSTVKLLENIANFQPLYSERKVLVVSTAILTAFSLPTIKKMCCLHWFTGASHSAPVFRIFIWNSSNWKKSWKGTAFHQLGLILVSKHTWIGCLVPYLKSLTIPILKNKHSLWCYHFLGVLLSNCIPNWSVCLKKLQKICLTLELFSVLHAGSDRFCASKIEPLST